MSSVCSTQDDFNKSFKKAINYTQSKNKPSRFSMIISTIIIIVLMTCALFIVKNQKIQGEIKIIHYILALILSPLYIIAFYLDSYKIN